MRLVAVSVESIRRLLIHVVAHRVPNLTYFRPPPPKTKRIIYVNKNQMSLYFQTLQMSPLRLQQEDSHMVGQSGNQSQRQ